MEKNTTCAHSRDKRVPSCHNFELVFSPQFFFYSCLGQPSSQWPAFTKLQVKLLFFNFSLRKFKCWNIQCKKSQCKGARFAFWWMNLGSKSSKSQPSCKVQSSSKFVIFRFNPTVVAMYVIVHFITWCCLLQNCIPSFQNAHIIPSLLGLQSPHYLHVMSVNVINVTYQFTVHLFSPHTCMRYL